MTGGSRHRRGHALRHAASASTALGVVLAAACYSTGDGTPPPPTAFYYPVGLAVSSAGNVLYAVNSDFDLQYNGGTVQSYDLTAIRNDTIRLMLGLFTGAAPFDAGVTDGGIPVDAGPLPFAAGGPTDAGCPNTVIYPPPVNPNDPNGWNGGPGRLPVGQACAPPMTSSGYLRHSVTIGAFATDIQLSKNKDRLFVPVRGDATLTWIDVPSDEGAFSPLSDAHFNLYCAVNSANRCTPTHQAGLLADPGNTRQLKMPGEPFAMAFSDDGTAIALTHQSVDPNNGSGDTSLYLSGLVPGNTVPNRTGSSGNFDPSIQFVVNDLPLGGDGIVAIPHDPAAVTTPDPANPLRPAFLQTSNQVAEIDLLRYYSDEGYQGTLAGDGGPNLVDAGVAVQVGSSNLRPFLIKERAYAVRVNANGSNSRGIAIDNSPRIACEANAVAAGLPQTDPAYVACAQTPARVFIASRSPPSLILGQIGGMSGEGTTYDPDQLTISGNLPLANGPSNVYVAPIVDKTGRYAVRVFIVCFDSQTIEIYDPDTGLIENVVSTAPGPFAMAFDPFDPSDVATHQPVPADPRSKYMRISNGAVAGPALLRYRFGYLTSFTNSFVQVIDLDQSFSDDRLQGQSTFETMVYSLGLPTQPVGSN